MTAQPYRNSRMRGTSRTAAVLSYDGVISTILLRIFAFFVTSVSFFACAVPAVVFQVVVGWQPTHVAVWLGAVSLLPLVPAMFASLTVADRVLLTGDRRDAGRVFWDSFGRGVRSMWKVTLAVGGLIVLLGYDLALYGDDDRALLLGSLGLAVLFVAVLAMCSSLVARPRESEWVLVVDSLRAMAVRPHVGLCWILLTAVAVAAATLPVVGAAVALSAPALVACAIVVCNRALSFHPRTPEASS